MKNVSLVPMTREGRPSFRLVGPDGRRIEAFDIFAKSIGRRPFNTVESYCNWLARFMDYFIEATTLLASSDTKALSRNQLVDVISAYEEYLVYGADSGNEIAVLVDKASPSPRLPGKTADQMHAPVRIFLDLSNTVREQVAELVAHGLSRQPIDNVMIFESQKVEPTIYQRRALLARSMLAGVLSEGTKYLSEAILPSSSRSNHQPVQDEDAFPFDLASSLFEGMDTWRDKALYSLCAASGCRGSEARQVLWEDIDFVNRRVRLVAPLLRPNHPSYLALTPAQRKKYIAWKGRNTAVTFLIEPFASDFFNALENYVLYEYVAHGLHQFVFQNITGKRPGTPYLLTSRSTRSATFRSAVIRLASTNTDERLTNKTAHALRHMYAFYLVNYCPRADGGFGLPLALVKIIMGHQQITSTEEYARQDRDLVEADLSYANRKMLFGDAYKKTLNETKREILVNRLKAVDLALAEEQTISLAGIRK